MGDADFCVRSLVDVAEEIRAGRLSPVEVARRQIERIDAVEPRLHAYLSVSADRALEAARAAQDEIRAGRYRGPLHGIPVAVKDLCWTTSLPTTCASRLLDGWMAPQNAAVVERLEAAGAVIFGKLNCTEFAMTWYHPSLPAAVNPWDAERWAGSSSSGSGVAPAAGLAFAAIGTDTLGSIRFPAAANGIVGLKPTYGRVSRFGVFPLAETLDHVGPMTRTVADAAIVFQAIAGFDSRDPTSRSEPVPDVPAALAGGADGIRVGFDATYVGDGSSPDVATAVGEAVRTLERLGARVVPVEFPSLDGLAEAAITICAVEALVAHERTFPARAAEYGPGFRSFLAMGSRFTAVDYAKAHLVRETFRGRLLRLFEAMDVLACPAMPMIPPPISLIGEEADENWMNGNVLFVRFTAPFNLAGTPTLTLPCGFVDGLPVALQLVGPPLGEETILRVGYGYERATGWHGRRPKDT